MGKWGHSLACCSPELYVEGIRGTRESSKYEIVSFSGELVLSYMSKGPGNPANKGQLSIVKPVADIESIEMLKISPVSSSSR